MGGFVAKHGKESRVESPESSESGRSPLFSSQLSALNSPSAAPEIDHFRIRFGPTVEFLQIDPFIMRMRLSDAAWSHHDGLLQFIIPGTIGSVGNRSWFLLLGKLQAFLNELRFRIDVERIRLKHHFEFETVRLSGGFAPLEDG